MIFDQIMFSACCDNCGEPWCDPDGCIAFSYKSGMDHALRGSGWHFGNKNEGEDGKHYCPDCWYYDDDDNFCLKEIEK